jgi:hypothetical protein
VAIMTVSERTQNSDHHYPKDNGEKCPWFRYCRTCMATRCSGFGKERFLPKTSAAVPNCTLSTPQVKGLLPPEEGCRVSVRRLRTRLRVNGSCGHSAAEPASPRGRTRSRRTEVFASLSLCIAVTEVPSNSKRTSQLLAYRAYRPDHTKSHWNHMCFGGFPSRIDRTAGINAAHLNGRRQL